jgi:DNA-binding CsgD family transcriptional regulator
VTNFARASLDVAGEVARIAETPVSIKDRAAALLRPLSRLVPFQAAWIGLLAVGQFGHTELLDHGHDERFRRYLAGPETFQQIEVAGVNRNPGALCLRTSPVPESALPAWELYLRPAGFKESLGTGLFTPDGRYLGIFLLHLDTVDHPTDEALDVVSLLAPRIAAALDPLRSLAGLAGIVRDATAGIALTRDLEPLPLPGLAGHSLLASGAGPLAVVGQRLTDGETHLSFLWPVGADPADQRLLRVTGLATASPSPHLIAVVTLSPPGDQQGLGRQELEILGLLAEDRPDRRIATALRVSPARVADSVAVIMAKLGAPTRKVAILRACRLGLYIPPGWPAARR